MLTSFPWYDLPSVQWANDSLWRATGYPGELNRQLAAADLWQDPGLLVSQACGLDLFLSNAPIEPIAAPVFDLDCTPGMYYSYIVGDLKGQTAAVNSLSSRSGWSALLSMCNPKNVVVTGSHQASIKALKSGKVDVAAIDAVTWRILARDTPESVAGLEIVGRSSEAMAPPYVGKLGAEHETLFQSLHQAFGSPGSSTAKAALLIGDIIPVQRQHYLPILTEYRSVTNEASLKGQFVFSRL